MTAQLYSDTEKACVGMIQDLPESVQQGVFGVGVDIASIDRMKLAIERSGEGFLNRVYTEKEVEYCRAAERPFERFAACWAAKEAAVKALGTGFRYSISFKDIELESDGENRPTLNLTGKFKDLMDEKEINFSTVSISHEESKSIAIVMLCRV